MKKTEPALFALFLYGQHLDGVNDLRFSPERSTLGLKHMFGKKGVQIVQTYKCPLHCTPII
jgi:hypothetical protein